MALPGGHQELRLDVRGARHRATDRHLPPELLRTQVADAAVGRQVVEGHRELQPFRDLDIDILIQSIYVYYIIYVFYMCLYIGLIDVCLHKCIYSRDMHI